MPRVTGKAQLQDQENATERHAELVDKMEENRKAGLVDLTGNIPPEIATLSDLEKKTYVENSITKLRGVANQFKEVEAAKKQTIAKDKLAVKIAKMSVSQRATYDGVVEKQAATLALERTAAAEAKKKLAEDKEAKVALKEKKEADAKAAREKKAADTKVLKEAAREKNAMKKEQKTMAVNKQDPKQAKLCFQSGDDIDISKMGGFTT